MKILIVTGGIVKGGVSKVISLLSQEWSKQHEVDVFLFRSAEELAFPIGGKIIQSDILFRGCILSQVFYIYKVINNSEYDKIIGFSENVNYPLVIAAKIAGCLNKTILTVHNAVGMLSAKVKRRAIKFYPMASEVLVVSQGIKKDLIELGLDETKVKYVHNPVDLQAVNSLSLHKPCINFSNLNFNIISVGRLHAHKGFDNLIRALKLTLERIPNAKLYLVGEGPEYDALNGLVIELGLKHHVEFLGFVSNPYALMHQADIFVLSSRFEGFGLVLIEAMACSLPIVSFNCPSGPAEIITHQKNGILVENQNIDMLSNEIVLLSDKENRKKYVLNAKKRVTDFDVRYVANDWLS